jgi:hypothetical protein
LGSRIHFALIETNGCHRTRTHANLYHSNGKAHESLPNQFKIAESASLLFILILNIWSETASFHFFFFFLHIYMLESPTDEQGVGKFLKRIWRVLKKGGIYRRWSKLQQPQIQVQDFSFSFSLWRMAWLCRLKIYTP